MNGVGIPEEYVLTRPQRRFVARKIVFVGLVVKTTSSSKKDVKYTLQTITYRSTTYRVYVTETIRSPKKIEALLEFTEDCACFAYLKLCFLCLFLENLKGSECVLERETDS